MNSQFFERVNNIDWFSNCGKEFTIENFPMKIQFVRSIDEMEKNLQLINWENATLEARNRLAEFLDEYFRKNHIKDARQHNWNRIAEIHKSKLGFI